MCLDLEPLIIMTAVVLGVVSYLSGALRYSTPSKLFEEVFYVIHYVLYHKSEVSKGSKCFAVVTALLSGERDLEVFFSNAGICGLC